MKRFDVLGAVGAVLFCAALAACRGGDAMPETREAEPVTVHVTEPMTTAYTIPVEAWCGSLLTPGEYRVPIKYGNFFDPELYVDAWYFTVTE